MHSRVLFILFPLRFVNTICLPITSYYIGENSELDDNLANFHIVLDFFHVTIGGKIPSLAHILKKKEGGKQEKNCNLKR